MLTVGWMLAFVGVAGVGLLARRYTSLVAQVFLTIAGGICLWFALVGIYANFFMNIDNPIPFALTCGVLPVVSIIIIGIVVFKIPKNNMSTNEDI